MPDPTRSFPGFVLGSSLRFIGTRALLALVVVVLFIGSGTSQAQSSLKEHLKDSPFKIAYETYVDGNWEIFVMNADGSHPVNLTKTPGQHEHYPQVSPDGTKICYSVDTG